MPTAQLNGTTLYFETAGAGPPCLVLHGGLGVDHTYLRPGLDRLGDRLALVYIDHRGHGRSGRSAEPPSVAQLADDADALAAHLGHRGVVVLAHSWGGFVAQDLALRHPGRVAGLVLVASTAGELGSDESLLDDLGPPLPVEVDILTRVPPATDEELEATVRALVPYYLHTDRGPAGDDVFAGCRFDAGAMARSMHILGAWSSIDRLDTLDVPSLLVGGRHDVFCPPEQLQRMARRMPSAEVAIFEESAHLPWVDEPDRFVDVVEEWLDRLP
ncbi:MAG TPA: alpha/beta hydrolase [Acidimicrobiales bacterium]|nr:alpha/beta hydrolase [Acidimicrobiales bacterium]